MDDLFKFLSQEARELQFGTTVPELCVDEITPLSFYRSHVSPNQPLLIQNACRHWPAFRKWNKQYFCDRFGEKDIVVAVTPNGYADAVAFDPETQKEYFVMPEERKMTFVEFWQTLDNPAESNGIYYLQRQNSNLTEELPELLQDIEKQIPWATEAFGVPPDAINFWVGDGRAITSMHKDPYENIYCVVSGHKDFILLPPTDRPWIPYNLYPTASYFEVSHGKFVIKPTISSTGEHSAQSHTEFKDTVGKIPWISIDPLAPNLNKHPSYRNTSPLHVRVKAGDALFLPSLWYHHVRQSHGCIAVNYWYDMQYDIKYVYHKFLETLVEKTGEKIN